MRRLRWGILDKKAREERPISFRTRSANACFHSQQQPIAQIHPFVTTLAAYHCSILYENDSPDRRISQLVPVEPTLTVSSSQQSLSRSFVEFVSMARFLVLVAAFLLPIYVHAVAFSVDSFEGIAVGKPMNLSWWGDKTVRITTSHHIF